MNLASSFFSIFFRVNAAGTRGEAEFLSFSLLLTPDTWPNGRRRRKGAMPTEIAKGIVDDRQRETKGIAKGKPKEPSTKR